MDATEVLQKLSALGITARASGEKLLLQSGSKVPSALLTEVRQCKGDILDYLRRQPGLANPPEYAATGCICPAPIGPTGEGRCAVCQLPSSAPVVAGAEAASSSSSFHKEQAIIEPLDGAGLAACA